jgi:CRP-like cAMP-binding protein
MPRRRAVFRYGNLRYAIFRDVAEVAEGPDLVAEATNHNAKEPQGGEMHDTTSLSTYKNRPQENSFSTLETIGTTMSYRQSQGIYRPSDPVDYSYRLIGGAARRFTTQRDGRRQIVDFLLPHDFFGFSTRHEHSFSVEAITEDTRVKRYPRARIDALIDSDPRVGRLIRDQTAAEIARLQARILLLSRITSREKINAFFLEMTRRLAGGADVLVLPMSRYDIADYLAVSVETVSRCFTDLEGQGAIKFAGRRHVQLIDRKALDDIDAENARLIA